MKKKFLLSLIVIGLVGAGISSGADGEWKRPERSPGPPVERLGNGGHGAKRGGSMRGDWMERLREENPEEFEALSKMREEDPEAFRAAVRERMKKRVAGFMRHRGVEQDQEARELSQKYHAAGNDEEKSAIKVEIEKKVYEAFDARLEGQKRMINQLEEQLEKLKQQVEEREQNREAICRKRVGNLTEDPDLKW